MRIRTLTLIVAGWAALAAAGLPGAQASGPPPNSGSFIASDFSWDAAGGGKTVTIAQGGTMNFSYPSGRSEHNAHFTTGQPSSCLQTAGPSSGSVPPLPRQPTSQGWSGTCVFNQPGIYRFHCDVHPFMIGTVAVQAGGTTAQDSPLAGAPGQTVRVAGVQRGARIRGIVKVSRAGQGGSLRVAVLARASDLGRRGSRQVSVGSTGATLEPGSMKFSVALNGAARSALRRRGRLSVEVKLLARTPAGRAVRVSRAVRVLLG